MNLRVLMVQDLSPIVVPVLCRAAALSAHAASSCRRCACMLRIVQSVLRRAGPQTCAELLALSIGRPVADCDCPEGSLAPRKGALISLGCSQGRG